MTRLLNGPTRLAVALLAVSALAIPLEAQRAVTRDGGAPVGGGEGRQPSPSGPSGGGSSGGGGSASGGATSRSGDSAPAPRTSDSAAPERSRQAPRDASAEVLSSSRPRDGQVATGRAVPRRGAPPSGDDDIDVIYYPGGYYGYYPWGYGGFGFGGYYGSYYDPWYYPYDYGQYYSGDGSLRLKVKPREATVYADGYYVGRVDDFDGVFQKLHIEPGPHRIEIRMDGYETLEFEVRLLPDRTLTYEGELKKLP
jgi:PEGA domain